MNKILRYSLVCLLAIICGSTYAQEVTINFDDDYETLFPEMGTSSGSGENYVSDGEFASNFTTTPQDGITFTIEASSEEAAYRNRLWASAPRLRMYDGTLSINSEKAFSKIVFTLSTNKARIADENTVDKGSLTKTDKQSNATVIWTGDATTSLVITIAGNTQFSKAVVTLGEGGGGDTPPTPSFDGPTVSNIAAFLECTEEAKLQLSDALVTYVNDYNGLQLFVRDNTGAMVIDKNMDFTGIKTGDILTCDIIGKPGSISGFKNAFLKSDNSSIENLSTSTGEVTYKEISIDEAGDFMCDAIVLKNATIADKKASVDGDEIALYDRFKLGLLDELDESSTYNVYGLIYDGGDQYGMEIVVVKIELADNSGVNAITANKNSNAPVYNMAGQRVSKAVKGVYIQNGKKFVVK